MRLKRGDKVEVLRKQETSSGSWSCAEIISGNGHTYSIRYCSFPVAQELAVGRVPRRAIRPCPPTVEGPTIWVPGDLAEVYHNFSWKQGKIIKVNGDGIYIVRLLGSPLDIMVGLSHLRMRQAWQDGKWLMLRKAPYVIDSTFRNRKMSARIEPNILKTEDKKTQMLSTPLKKRRFPLESSKPEAQNISVHRRKVAENDIGFSPPLPKADATYSLQKSQRLSLDASSPTSNIGVPKVDIGGRDQEIIPGTSNHIHVGSCGSSVCSTSYKGNVFQLPLISVQHPSINVADEDYFSDAESSTRLECQKEGHSSLTDEEVLAKFHRSELHVYRSFIKTLHASGPLRWEDEEELTNIRVALHISNDEHLIELRHLRKMIPAKTSSI